LDLVDLLFSFKGRVSRLPYWTLNLIVLSILLTPLFIEHSYTDEQLQIFENIMILITFWPLLAIQIKRWHDRNKPAWWVLINFVPVIGVIWVLIELGFLRGTQGANDYGDDPLVTQLINNEN
jgi:uncharacterized membrane protein YhaH (DUF805 family)